MTTDELAGLPEALEGAWAAIKDADTWNALREYVERLTGDLNAERLRADTYVAKYEVAQERLQLLSTSQNERADNALELWRCTETELVEYKQSADLRWKCDMRAIKAWRTAHPGNELTWPDHADLCVWLMTELDALRAKINEAKNAELFEDGLSADLHCDGIKTLPEAYMQGRLDVLSEIGDQ